MSPPSSRLQQHADSVIALRRSFGAFILDAAVGIGEVEIELRARDDADQPLTLRFPLQHLQTDAAFRSAYLQDCDLTLALGLTGLDPVDEVGETLGQVWRRGPVDETVTLDVLLRRIRASGGSFGLEAALAVGVQVASTIAQVHEITVQIDAGDGAQPLAFGRIGLGLVGLGRDGVAVVRVVPSPGGRLATCGGHPARCAPAELAPEQLANDLSTGASDVYQAALLVYSLWSGGRPFTRRSRAESVVAVLGGAETLPGLDKLPAPVAAVLRRALSRNPKNRPSASSLAESLDTALAQLGGPPPPSFWAGLLGDSGQSVVLADSDERARLLDEVNRLLELAQRAGLPPPSLVMPVPLVEHVAAPATPFAMPERAPQEVEPVIVRRAPKPQPKPRPVATWAELRPALAVGLVGLLLIALLAWLPTGPELVDVTWRREGGVVAVRAQLDADEIEPEGQLRRDADNHFVVRLRGAHSDLEGKRLEVNTPPVSAVTVSASGKDLLLAVELDKGATVVPSLVRVPDGLEFRVGKPDARAP